MSYVIVGRVLLGEKTISPNKDKIKNLIDLHEKREMKTDEDMEENISDFITESDFRDKEAYYYEDHYIRAIYLDHNKSWIEIVAMNQDLLGISPSWILRDVFIYYGLGSKLVHINPSSPATMSGFLPGGNMRFCFVELE